MHQSAQILITFIWEVSMHLQLYVQPQGIYSTDIHFDTPTHNATKLAIVAIHGCPLFLDTSTSGYLHCGNPLMMHGFHNTVSCNGDIHGCTVSPCHPGKRPLAVL